MAPFRGDPREVGLTDLDQRGRGQMVNPRRDRSAGPPVGRIVGRRGVHLVTRRDQARQRRHDPTRFTVLVARPRALSQPRHRNGIDVLQRHRRREQRSRQPLGSHQRVADRRNVVILLVVLHQDTLTQQITERDSKRPCQIYKHIKAANLPLATLDLAQPVLGTTYQVSENNL